MQRRVVHAEVADVLDDLGWEPLAAAPVVDVVRSAVVVDRGVPVVEVAEGLSSVRRAWPSSSDRAARAPITPTTSNSNVPLVTHVGYSSAVAATAVPIVQFTPPAGGEYAPGALVSNFWRTQISARISF